MGDGSSDPSLPSCYTEDSFLLGSQKSDDLPHIPAAPFRQKNDPLEPMVTGIFNEGVREYALAPASKSQLIT